MDSRLVFLVVFVIGSAVPYTKANGNITALNYNFTRSDCGKTKLCVEKPNQCDPSGTSECFFASTRISITDTSLAFELSGNSSGYIALAAGSSSNVSQGLNAVFVCGNNNGTFFFKIGSFTNNSLMTTTLFGASNIQYSLKEPSLIQCAFKIPITLSSINTVDVLGINFNIKNLSAFLEVFKGSTNGTDLGQPKSAFGSSVSVNLADVNSTNIVPTTATTAPTTKPTTSGSTSLFSHAALGLLAAVALRFL